MINIVENEFPILEFDGTNKVILYPSKNTKVAKRLPERCVISFFGEAIDAFIAQNFLEIFEELSFESRKLPLFLYETGGVPILLVHGFGSGPYAAALLEKLAAFGCSKIIVCGGCGVLEKEIDVGKILVPIKALRDEGTSYHYIAPSRFVDLNFDVISKIVSYLNQSNIPYNEVVTWTTDAIYRETFAKIALRKQYGCNVVEMECASFAAAAKFLGVDFGQILYAGDDLSSNEWDERGWKNLINTRLDVLKLAIKICEEL
jgi:uridine phosphorylase